MGKEEDSWDDFGLIHAFDNAISNFKIMHNQGEKAFSNDEEKVVNQGDGKLSTLSAQSCHASSEKDGGDDAASNLNVGVSDLPNSRNYQLASGDPDITATSMNGENIQINQIGILDTQSLEDYNQLLSRYYELEDQRQKVLQQLSQFGYWDYQNSNASGWDQHTIPPAMTASHEHQAYAIQGSCSNVACTCCPYWSQFLSAPYTSCTSCGVGAASVDNIGNPTAIVEANEPETKLNLAAATDLNTITNA